MDTALLPKGALPDLYRFAWLLTGDADLAEEALAAALAELPKLDELRKANSRHVLLMQHLRQECLRHRTSSEKAPRLLRQEDGSLAPLEILEIEAYIVAQHFQGLAEPERSALALFYLPLLSQKESATLLNVSLEQYCELVGRGRENLHRRLLAMKQGQNNPNPAAV